MKIPAPVRKGELYHMEITAQGTDGEGIGKIAGFTVFVPGAAQGDVAAVRITKVNRSYAFAKLGALLQPSPYRSEPLCPVAAACGGCNLMHVAYQKQLALKRQRVTDALERIGGFAGVAVEDTIGMDKPWRYRNKMQLPVGTDSAGRPCTGFFAPRSHRIVPADDCLVGGEICKAVTRSVLDYMEACGVSAYDEKTHKGIIRHVFVRQANATGQVMVVVSANALHLLHSDVLVGLLKENTDGLIGVIHNINMEKTNLILGKNFVTLWGRDRLADILGGFKFEISPASFYQVNHAQTEKLYAVAVELAGLTGAETVFDLYCGIGTISVYMAQKAKKVIGIEIVEAAVSDARANADANGMGNACFYAGAVEDIAVRLCGMGEKADVVVLDPPRKGADALTLQTIAKLSSRRIVYVSCNPATLARDARLLADMGGYQISRVQPVDMFPHTTHVESVVLMTNGGLKGE